MYTWENLNRQYSWYLRRASSTSKISYSRIFLKVSLFKNQKKVKIFLSKFSFRHMPGFSALLGLWNCQIWVYVSFYDILCLFICLCICHFYVILSNFLIFLYFFSVKPEMHLICLQGMSRDFGYVSFEWGVYPWGNLKSINIWRNFRIPGATIL